VRSVEERAFVLALLGDGLSASEVAAALAFRAAL